MNISGMGNDYGYNFYRVSGQEQGQDTKTESLKFQLAHREETTSGGESEDKKVAQQTGEKDVEQRRLNETIQKKLDDAYASLSDKAKEYLKTLQQRYSNMDFYVADASSDEEAQSIMSQGTKEYSVLLDADTLEAMANDESVASQYESMIADAAEQLTGLREELTNQGVNIKSVGMQIDSEGKTTYYSILDESLSYYDKELEKQEKKRADRAEARKQAELEQAKKEETKKNAEKAESEKDAERTAERKKEEQIAQRKEEKVDEQRRQERQDQMKAQSEQHQEFMEKQLKGQFAMVSAGTIEELKAKLGQEEDKVLRLKRDMTPVGAGIDFSI